jgi:hypothetical protein
MNENTQKTEKETKSKKFDGVVTFKEPININTYQDVTKKIFLSDDEVEKFIGDTDPSLYFKDGRIPLYVPKSFGTLLSEERPETLVLRKEWPLYKEALLFKHDMQNIYTILIPKKYSEHELNESGDFRSNFVRYDTRSVAFTGGMGRPSSFEPDYFKKHLVTIKRHLDKAKDLRGL